LQKLDILDYSVERKEYSLCLNSDIDEWENINSPYKLPQDLKQFYTVTNGIKLQWFTKSMQSKPRTDTKNNIHEQKEDTLSKDLVGYSRISSLQELTPLPSTMLESIQNQSNQKKMKDFSVVHGFLLESIPDYGKIILLYGLNYTPPEIGIEGDRIILKDNTQEYEITEEVSNGSKIMRPQKQFRDPNIWFLDDRYEQWTFLTSDFSCYFRLMLVHLGILGWQYAFVRDKNDKELNLKKKKIVKDINCLSLDPRCQYYMRLYAPERLAIDITHVVPR